MCFTCMDNSSNTKFEFRLPEDLRNRFNLACRKNGVNSSSVLRMLITNDLEENNPQTKFSDDDPHTSGLKIPSKSMSIGEMYCELPL